MKHFPILGKIGLSQGEAVIYELLLERGRSRAGDLVEPAGLGRGNTYNILNSLQSKRLIQVIEGKQKLYESIDPSQLRELLNLRVRETQRMVAEFDEELGDLQSTFQLSTGKPSLEIYEGLAGIERAIFDTLESQTDICAYVDVHAISGDLAQINSVYVRARMKQQLPKRLIVSDTVEARAFFQNQDSPYTRVAFVKHFPAEFKTALEIYDGSVSHITLTESKKIAVIIRDHSIYLFHKGVFDYIWTTATSSK